MGISFGSIATGLPKDIVKQILEAEKIPVKKMEQRKAKTQSKQKLVTELIGLVEGIRGNINKTGDARSLREFRIDTNTDIIDVTADKNIAEPGQYQFEVKQLAQKSSAMSSGFESKEDSYLGVGFINFTLPNGEKKEIYVDSDNSSLEKVAKMINQDSDLGVRANVINDGNNGDKPWHLLLSLKDTGDINKAEFPYFYFVDGEEDFYIEYEREAQNAIVKLDGFEVALPNNKANDLIPGLTIDLLKAAPGEEFTIKIGEDVEAIGKKVSDLIESINQVLSFIKEQNTLDENSDTSQTLGGDIVLQSLEGRIRTTVFKPVQTSKGMFRIGDLGVNFQKDGSLKLDEKKFDSMIASNYTAFSQVLTGYFGPEGKTKGFVDNIKEMVNNSLRYPDGLLVSRKRTVQSKIDEVDRRIEQKEKYLEQKEQNLKSKFARLEETISRIKSQGAGVAAIGGGAGANPVTQLG